MLDRIFLTVGDIKRWIAFYTATLGPLGITQRLDYNGRGGSPDHPDHRGFGAKGRMFFWLRAGNGFPGAVHVGFVADSKAMVDAAHAAALAAGAREIHRPGPQRHYDPRYYAAKVLDADGYSLEFVYKTWQHGSWQNSQ